MITTQEFRPINAKEKPGIDNLQSCHNEITKIKAQVNPKVHQCIAMDVQIYDLEKKLEILRNTAKQIKNSKTMEIYINNFFKSYEKFSEYLTSDLASYDAETKNKIKNELIKLTHLMEEVIENYLK